MASEICNWRGRSGRVYQYVVHSLPVVLRAGQLGNYIYTAAQAHNRWVPIYIGQGDLGDRVSENHHRSMCIKLKGATHVHTHTNLLEEDRLVEERDLLGSYRNAYEPYGCNRVAVSKPGVLLR